METAISILVHIGIVWLVLRAPSYVGDVIPIEQGAGGPGPAGGGGGSRAETVQYIQLQPAPPPQPKPVLVFTAPEIKPVPPPEPPKLEPVSAPVSTGVTSSADPNGGSGPGSGGGVGSGVGSGKGSSVGPGTGGGDQANFAPTTDQMFLPPFPVPNSLRGKAILVEFDIDERGRIAGLVFTPSGDRGYDRRLTDVFKSYRFKAGHRPDGTPIRMKFQLKMEL